MNIKNKILTNIVIEGIAAEGKCIAKNEGQIIFVSNVAPGDVCDLRIVRRKKSFLEAVPVKIHEYSSLRSEPFCEHFGTCGGCKWQHINYETQLKYKQQQVVDNLERIGKIDFEKLNPIIGSENTKFYRNKLEFTFTNARWLTKEEIGSDEELDRDALGFHMPGRFDKILDIEKCHLQADPSNAIRLAVKEFAKEKEIPFFNLVRQTGFLRNLIIRTASTGQVMVILQVTAKNTDWINLILDLLSDQFPEITSLNYVVNNKGNDTFHDLKVINVAGTPFIEEQMKHPDNNNTITFRVGPKSFYQTNSAQAEVLYKLAWELADFKGDETVYDLYTGTGTIANYVASSVKKVIGIEYVEAAIEDAKVNSQINEIKNTSFYAGDMKDLLTDDFIAKNGSPDVIITDPPRAGMHPDVCNVLLKSNAKRIVYISCNPATQARDLALLESKYAVKVVQPVDMFPQTHHVENIALLELKN
ncbi:MAG TPA: 23S rRNA (uracil(1939)-C(5))-methyltransferase RlmD [Fulvivirga sp.]|nr:23S rRNA (uracil(1939)-C(5))-methyltransferase RlmD [Fulvivirga sp.]